MSFASLEAHIGSDLCLDLVDIVSFNIYPRWFHDTPVTESLANLNKFMENLDGAGKPILISEIDAGVVFTVIEVIRRKSGQRIINRMLYKNS